jgi:hypothetical protein
MSGIIDEICARSFPPEAGVFEASGAKNKDLGELFVKMGKLRIVGTRFNSLHSGPNGSQTALFCPRSA